jgi:hypothetical protein
MPVEKAANRIVRQMKKGKYRIIVGPLMYLIDYVSRFMPTLLHRLIGKYRNRFGFV